MHACMQILEDEQKVAGLCLTEQHNAMAKLVPEEAGDFSWASQGPGSNLNGGDKELLAVRSVPRHALLQVRGVGRSELGGVEGSE
jgi:hypothetical protein